VRHCSAQSRKAAIPNSRSEMVRRIWIAKNAQAGGASSSKQSILEDLIDLS
jgi:hypothetical protein